MAVLSVGPLITFGFLLIPVLTAHLVSRNMRQLIVLSSMFGGVAAFVGFCIGYKWDMPVGPTDIVLLGILYVMAWIGVRLLSEGMRHINS